MKRNVLAIIQARMNSTRLPGKVMRELCGKPMLHHIIQRAGQTEEIGRIMVAASVHEDDDPIEALAKSMGVPCFRGSEEDVLARFWEAAKSLGAEMDDCILRLTADNPLVDPIVMKELLVYFAGTPYGYAATSGYPLGLGAEAFTFRELEEAYRFAGKPYEREHVTPYMYQASKQIGRLAAPADWSKERFTVDTPEDWTFVETIYNALYHGKHDFYLQDILSFLDENPEIRRINSGVRQKQLGE